MSLLPLILDRIEDADLPIAVYRTAVRIARLLDDNGQAIMSWEEYQTLTGCHHADAARRHLRTMGARGLIDWRGGAITVITWKIDADLLAENRQLLSENAQLVSENRLLLRVDNNEEQAATVGKRAVGVGKQADSVGKQAVAARSSHTRVLGRLGRSLSTTNTSKRNKPTYPPTSQTKNKPPPLRGDQQLAFELLVDSEVGVIHSVADDLARKLPPQDIYRAVDKWLPDAQVGKVTAGVLKHRLEKLKPSSAQTVKLSAAFRDSELFHRHRLPDELVADGKRSYNLDDYQNNTPNKRYSREAAP